jgi:hypothetical protein
MKVLSSTKKAHYSVSICRVTWVTHPRLLIFSRTVNTKPFLNSYLISLNLLLGE